KGGGRGEEGDGAVLADHAPERAGVRGADRLALVEDRGAALQQRPVDDVGVAHRPADVGGGPPHLAGANPVDVLPRPFERPRLASSLAAKPPKTTEWTAPRRAQASMDITPSGTIGM